MPYVSNAKCMRTVSAFVLGAFFVALVPVTSVQAALSVTGGTLAATLAQNQSVRLSTATLLCQSDGDIHADSEVKLFIAESTGAPNVIFDTTQTPTATESATNLALAQATPTSFTKDQVIFDVTGNCTAGERLTVSNVYVKVDPLDQGVGTANLRVFSAGDLYDAAPFTIDAQPPTISSGRYLDSNSDSMVDKVELTFSEPIVYPTFVPSEWSITAQPTDLIHITNASIVSGTGVSGTAVLTFNISATQNATSGKLKVNFTYDGTNKIKDVVGNANVSNWTVELDDHAGPKPKSARISDTDGDGRPDHASITYTEALRSDLLKSADWTVTSASDFQGSMTLGAIALPSINVIELAFAEPDTVRTDVGDITLTYAQGAVSVQAAQGTFTSAISGVTVKAAGGIYNVLSEDMQPIVSTHSPTAAASDVSLTAPIQITFSEPMVQGATVVSLTPSVALTATWSNSNRTVTYTHGGLAQNKSYTMKVQSASAAQGAVVALANEYTWNFTTSAQSLTFNPSISIEKGAAEVSSVSVSLALSAENATEMMIADGFSFSGKIWEPYTTAKAWLLPAGEGQKTVCVKFRSAGGVESETVCDTVTYTTTPGAPKNVSATINAGAATTAIATVTLTLSATDATEMRIANTSDFAGSIWEAYQATRQWTLTPGDGLKTVYVHYRSATGVTSSVVTDTITLTTTSTLPLPEGVTPGMLVKRPDISSVYYVGTDGKRYAFPHEKIFLSWYTKEQLSVKAKGGLVEVISAETLAQIPLANKMVVYRPGVRMVKIESDPKVYAVSQGGMLRWVKGDGAPKGGENLAKALYGAGWSKKIDDMSVAFFAGYIFGTDIVASSEFNPAIEQTSVSTISENQGL